jgi:methionyl-tRNA synthetase
MIKKPAYYITTPIYYVNDVPHIGHAYTTLACDVLARFKRLDGFNVMFLTGTDEHGQKVEKSAEAAGVSPLDFCDKVSSRFRDLLGTMNFSNDDFIRTTEERHKVACQALWKRLVDNGEIYEDKYAGWYSVRDEAYFGEEELIDGPDGEKTAPTGAPIEWVEEPSFFFRLSAWEDKLLEYYEAEDDVVMPKSRKNEVTSFVKGGLRDLSISRTSFNWGVPVPGVDGHIMYVWIDALTNYMSALEFPNEDSDKFQTFWPEVIHMVGKDILRFHAVYWPAFLMAAGLKPPKRVFAHGWWTNEGKKISKSLGNVIDPFEIVEEFGLDAVRYFLMREVPFGNDGDFSRTAFINRMNGELANDLGNLCQRSLSMIAKNCEGVVPAVGDYSDNDKAILDSVYSMVDEVRTDIDRQAISRSLEKIWKRVGEVNAYFANEAPWALKKTDPERMGTVLYVTAECVRNIALLVQPFMPDAMEKMLNLLAVDERERRFVNIGAGHSLKSGTELPAPVGIFPRFVEKD